MEFLKVYENNMVEIFRITERVYFRKSNLQIRRQCNGAFLVGDSGVALVDAPPESIEMVEEAARLFNKPVTSLFLTHGHGDHINGLNDFLKTDNQGGFSQGLTIFCSRRLLETMNPSLSGWRSSFIGVDGKLRLCLSGGFEVELFTLNDVAHTKWDMFIRIPDSGILCTGDSIVDFGSIFFNDADIRSWILSLRSLALENGNWLLSGHADKPLPYSYIGEFADFLETVERAALLCIKNYRPCSTLTDVERFADISVEKVKEHIEKFFFCQLGDARFLEEKAGPDMARRELRTVFWSLIRNFFR